MKFIDREEELAFLEREYAKKEASFVVLYGRRRLGKTSLATHFMANKPGIYFLATEEAEQMNINGLQWAIANYLEDKILLSISFTSWVDLFAYLAEKLPRDKKLVLVIDEFQYLALKHPEFLSVFQKIWDMSLKKQNIMLILCGSLISLMEAQTLSYTSPLYGRRTGQIKLKQIPFKYYQEFFPKRDIKELFVLYGLTGGVPKYIELVKDCTSLEEVLDDYMLNPNSFLYEEPIFLLQREVSDIGTYLSLVKVIAQGNQKLSHIATVLGVQQTNLPKYLQTLINLDIVERQVPVDETNPEKSKKGLYRLKDNYLQFWFKYVYPYRGFLESGAKSFVKQKILQNLEEGHLAFVYEEVCRQRLWEENIHGSLPLSFTKLGRWWDAHAEIDLVGINEEDSSICFVECKYHHKPVDVEVYYQLKEKSKGVKWHSEKRQEYFVLCSSSGFTERLEALAQNEPQLILMSGIWTE